MELSSIKIGNRIIGESEPPYIIAELSGNHNMSKERALELVRKAKECGADAVKLQTYKADTMTLDISTDEFFIKDPGSLWEGKSLYQLYEEAHTPWEWHEDIFKLAKDLGIDSFSSPFDETAVDFLEELDVPCYKIASFENTDIPLIRKIASTGKPVMMSTGMASLKELAISVEELKSFGCKEIILLKCTSAYPAEAKDANMLMIPKLRDIFDLNIGLSDHSMGNTVPLVATSLGVVVIEKHFTLDRNDGGVDSAFSMEPAEFKELVLEVKKAKSALGTGKFSLSDKEKSSKRYRRSIYISTDLNEGEVLSLENVKVIRPSLGLEPIHLENILGKKVNKNLKKGTPLSWDDF